MFLWIMACYTVPIVTGSYSDSMDARQFPVFSGFVSLSFYPLPLSVMQGAQETGYVNVTAIDTGYNGNDALIIRTCCLDNQISKLVDEEVTVDFILGHPKWFIFNISAYGVHLGRTQIGFYVSKNTSHFNNADNKYGFAESTSLDHVDRKQRKTHVESPSNDKNVIIDQLHLQLNETARSISVSRTSQNKEKALSSRKNCMDNLGKPGNLRDFNESSEWLCAEWWLLGRYDVVVTRPIKRLEPWVDYVMMIFIGINMLCVGGEIDPEEVLYLIKRPVSVLVGIFCRFGVMPALGLGIAEMMTPSHAVSLSVLSMICSPHEGASCLLSLLAERDLTFAITLLCLTNFASVALLPLWTVVLETRIYEIPEQAEIPFREIVVVFGYILICVTTGYGLEKKCPTLYSRVWKYLPAFTVFTFLFVCVVEVYRSSFIFALITPKVFFLSAMLAMAGYIFGFAVAFIARQPLSHTSVISMETGCHTTYITCLLLNASLWSPESDIARTTPVLGSLLSLTIGFLSTMIYRGYSRYKERDYANTVTTLDDCTERDYANTVTTLDDCTESGPSTSFNGLGQTHDVLTEEKETAM